MKEENKKPNTIWNLKEVNKEIEAKNPPQVKKLKTFKINFNEIVEKRIYYEGYIEAEDEESARSKFFKNPFGMDNIIEEDYEEINSWDNKLDNIEEIE